MFTQTGSQRRDAFADPEETGLGNTHLHLISIAFTEVIAIGIRGEVSQLIHKSLPEWSLPAVCLYAINVGLNLGDGEQACPFLLVDFGVY